MLADEHRRLRGREPQRLQRRLRPHRRARTAATTCSATTRPTTAATAASASIEVRVKRPGLRVRIAQRLLRGRAAARPRQARSAGRRSAPGAVTEAIGSPLPIGGMPIKVFAAPFKGTAPNAAVALAIEMRRRRLRVRREGTARSTSALEVRVHRDRRDRARCSPASATPCDLTLKPDTLARAKERGFRVVTQVEPAAGPLPAARRRGEARRQAPAACSTTSRCPTSIEGAAHDERRRADLRVGRRGADRASRRIRSPTFCPGPPTTMREFDARRRAGALRRVLRERARRAAAHARLQGGAARRRRAASCSEITDERSSTELQGKQGGYGFTARLPLERRRARALRASTSKAARAPTGDRRRQPRHPDSESS